MSRRQEWLDDAAGPLVRSYVIARERAEEARRDLDIITTVVAVAAPSPLTRPEPEYAAILKLCATPQSVAEVAAHIKVPLLVGKLLISDLIDDALLDYRSPQVSAGPAPDDLDLMRAVLNGIRNL